MDHSIYRNSKVTGRYFPYESLQHSLSDVEDYKIPSLQGLSVLGRQIPVYRFGSGNKKILMWSQMHGNESTTTKALLDAIQFLTSSHVQAKALLANLQIVVIPMLNPDGASAYTRVNANGIDLNRDFIAFSEPESQFLKHVFETEAPDFCFNLHDQRTIFSVGETSIPATLSFLGPAADASRSITPSRLVSMQIIAAINQQLQDFIPDSIGRYDDTYNGNCVGDHFQSLGVPTLLFEAGHRATDYQREETRTWVFQAILVALESIKEQSYLKFSVADYNRIPENQKNHLDLEVLHAHLINPKIKKNSRLAFQYEERLEDGKITFNPKIIDIEDSKEYFFHDQIDFSVQASENQSLVYQKISAILQTLDD